MSIKKKKNNVEYRVKQLDCVNIGLLICSAIFAVGFLVIMVLWIIFSDAYELLSWMGILIGLFSATFLSLIIRTNDFKKIQDRESVALNNNRVNIGEIVNRAYDFFIPFDRYIKLDEGRIVISPEVKQFGYNENDGLSFLEWPKDAEDFCRNFKNAVTRCLSSPTIGNINQNIANIIVDIQNNRFIVVLKENLSCTNPLMSTHNFQETYNSLVSSVNELGTAIGIMRMSTFRELEIDELLQYQHLIHTQRASLKMSNITSNKGNFYLGSKRIT